MNHFTYLVSVFVFCSPAILIMFKLRGGLLWKHRLLLLIMAGLSIPFAATEDFALRWGAWHYYNQNILGIQLAGAQIETYLVGLGVFMAVACATLIAITRTDRTNAGRTQ